MESTNTTTHLCKINRVTERSGEFGKYKSIKYVEETGFWMQSCRFNMFPDNALYKDIAPGMRIKLTANTFSRYYKNMIDVEKVDFLECDQCKKYYTPPTECTCDGEKAERLCGEWKLFKILKTERQSRLYFSKDNISFCNVVFSTSVEQILKEGKSYLLEGWRNTTTRHNIVIIHEIL